MTSAHEADLARSLACSLFRLGFQSGEHGDGTGPVGLEARLVKGCRTVLLSNVANEKGCLKSRAYATCDHAAEGSACGGESNQ